MHPRSPFGLLPPTVAWEMWAQLQRLVGPIVLLATVMRLHGAAAEQINVQEQEAIQQEIKRFEERFGSEGLSRHGDVYNNDPEDLYERSLAQ